MRQYNCVISNAIVIFWLWIVTIESHDVSTTIAFINDVLKFNAKATPPSRVNAFVCWGNDNIRLVHGLSRNGVLVSVHTSLEQWPYSHVPGIEEEPVLFLVDLECTGSHQLLQQASNLQLFSAPTHWLLIDNHFETDIKEENSSLIYDHETALNTTELYQISDASEDLVPINHSEAKDMVEVFETNLGLNEYIVENVAEKLYLSNNESSIKVGGLRNKPCKTDPISGQLEDMFLTETITCEPQKQIHASSNLGHTFKKQKILDKYQKLQLVDHRIHDRQQGLLKSKPQKHQINHLDVQTTTENVLFDCYNVTFGAVDVFVDSHVLIGRSVSKKRFELVEVYKRGPQEALVLTVIGVWDLQHGVQWNTELVLAARRTNLQQTLLKAAMVVTNPNTLNHLDDLVDKHIDTITKVNYLLLTHVLEAVNASVEYITVDSWGYATNGSWSGMVGCLQRKEAEIGATALFFTQERIPVLDYIAMTTPTRAAFVFRQPPLSYVSNIFTLPFTTAVWVASAMLVALSAIMLYMTTHWEWRRRDPQLHPDIALYMGQQNDQQQLRASWGEVSMLMLGAVCQQGSPFESRGVPGRIVTILLFIAVMFLYTSYSANIVALLQSSTSSIRTLNDLLHSRLQLGVHDMVYNRHYFKVASDPVRKAIYQKKVVPPNAPERFMPLEEGIERVRKGLFAFHLELSSGYSMIQNTFREDEKCGLQTIPFLQVVDPYLAVRKNTPYKEILKISYRKILERGLQDRTLRRLYTRKPKCVNKGSSFVSVGIIDCYPALLVLLYGVACSLSMFFLEILINKRDQMRRRAFIH